MTPPAPHLESIAGACGPESALAEASGTSLRAELEAVRQRCAMLEADGEQLRHAVGQLAKDNHAHQRRANSGRVTRRRRLAKLAGTVWQGLNKHRQSSGAGAGKS